MQLVDQVSTWIAEQVAGARADGVVLGLSGGIDSAVVSGLAARGLGPDRVYGVGLPIHSMREDLELAAATADAWGIPYEELDLAPAYDALVGLLPSGSDLANANIKPRLRMITLYHIANSRNCLVLGTSNRSERMIGYSTKWGDGAADIFPIASLYKWQVREIAREIGVPQAIIDRPPSAGLWPGQTDEQEMGFGYPELDAALAAIDSGKTDEVEPDFLDRITQLIARSEHKRRMPAIFVPD